MGGSKENPTANRFWRWLFDPFIEWLEPTTEEEGIFGHDFRGDLTYLIDILRRILPEELWKEITKRHLYARWGVTGATHVPDRYWTHWPNPVFSICQRNRMMASAD